MAGEIFISYCRKDKEWLDNILNMFKPSERQAKNFSIWVDNKIEPGTKWQDEIENALALAKVAILLVSQDFLASDFIMTYELPQLLTAAKQNRLILLWIAVRPSTYVDTEIKYYQALNEPSIPLSTMETPDREFKLVEIYEKIKKAVNINTIQISSEEMNKPLKPKSSHANRPTKVKQIGSKQFNSLSERLQRGIETLQISNEIRRNLSEVLDHPYFPDMMSISGDLVNNPIWQNEALYETRLEMIDKYRLDGPSAPQIVHLDLMLLCCTDAQRIGLIYTYYSSDDWGYLIPNRKRSPKENLNHRQEINAAELAKYLPVHAEHVYVKPLADAYAISAKKHAEHQDLTIYIYEF